MKLVMTLLARDEADIVDAQIAFHLHAGVDFVIATDNLSSDGTTEILRRYERDGVLHLLREDGDDLRQDEWVTRMARLAATDFGADWVINSDADEFWWPRGGTLKDVFALVPERFGVVRGIWRHFVPRPEGEADFAERMTVRLASPAHPADKRTIYHAHQKVAHRAHPQVVVERGNHGARAPGLEPLRGWCPIEIFHFSFRTFEQSALKAARGAIRMTTDVPSEHVVLLDDAFRSECLAEYFGALVIDDEQLARGLERGDLFIDTRLRDALRPLRLPDGTFRLPDDGQALACGAPTVDDAASFAAEAAALADLDSIARAAARVEALEVRLATLRTLPRR